MEFIYKIILAVLMGLWIGGSLGYMVLGGMPGALVGTIIGAIVIFIKLVKE